MTSAITRLLALSMAVLLLPGCKKKPRAAEAPSQQPAAAARGVDATEGRTPGPEGATASAAEDPDMADPALAGVPAELLASDRAYEAWFKKYNLDLNDPNMLEDDADGDGFSNRDEFVANTSPRDPNERPGLHTTLRLQEYREVTLPFVVESVEGDRARIKRMDGAEGAPETVRAGQTLGGSSYKVERVISRRDFDKDGNPIDRSAVVITDTSTAERLTLVKDMPAVSAESYAVLTSADGETTHKVKQGETFTWPADGGTEYKVIDLRADQAVVQEVSTRKMWTILRQ